jgi:two-component system LytT family response regulator
MTPGTPFRVLVVDDEAPARRKLLRLLRAEPGVQVVGEADGGDSAILAIERLAPELVFLDVQMPGTDGFAVVRGISSAAANSKKPLPHIIFVTAHDQYALRAFEVHAFDYLLKPVAEERFREALSRARAQHEQANGNDAETRLRDLFHQMQRERGYSDRLLIREGERAFFLAVSEICWIEADRNYVFVHAAGKRHSIRATLDSVEDSLDPKSFVRINRGSLVRLDAIRELQPWFHGEYKVILRDNTELRWSRRYVSQRPELLKLP